MQPHISECVVLFWMPRACAHRPRGNGRAQKIHPKFVPTCVLMDGDTHNRHCLMYTITQSSTKKRREREVLSAVLATRGRCGADGARARARLPCYQTSTFARQQHQQQQQQHRRHPLPPPLLRHYQCGDRLSGRAAAAPRPPSVGCAPLHSTAQHLVCACE